MHHVSIRELEHEHVNALHFSIQLPLLFIVQLGRSHLILFLGLSVMQIVT